MMSAAGAERLRVPWITPSASNSTAQTLDTFIRSSFAHPKGLKSSASRDRHQNCLFTLRSAVVYGHWGFLFFSKGGFVHIVGYCYYCLAYADSVDSRQTIEGLSSY